MTHDLTPQGPREGTSPKERNQWFVRATVPHNPGPARPGQDARWTDLAPAQPWSSLAA